MNSEQMRDTAQAILKHIGISALANLVIDTDEELGVSPEPGTGGIQIEGYYIGVDRGTFTLCRMTAWTEYGQSFAEPDLDDPIRTAEELDPLVFDLAELTLHDWIENAARAWSDPEEY